MQVTIKLMYSGKFTPTFLSGIDFVYFHLISEKGVDSFNLFDV